MVYKLAKTQNNLNLYPKMPLLKIYIFLLYILHFNFYQICSYDILYFFYNYKLDQNSLYQILRIIYFLYYKVYMVLFKI